MTVSVVIVNHDAGAILKDCVRRALADPATIEVVVVDNASTDGSADAAGEGLAPDGRFTVIRNEANVGFARAANQGMKRARGRCILLLNPDCLVEPDAIDGVASLLMEEPGGGMAGCVLRNPDGSEQRGGRRRIPDPSSALRRDLRLLFGRSASGGFDLAGTPLPQAPVDVEAISGAFMMVRRDALERVGGLDEGFFLHCEDLDWCLRFRRAGYRVLFVPSVSAVHAKGTCSRRRPVFVEWHKHRGMIRFYRKHFRRNQPFGVLPLVVAGIVLRFLARAVWVSARRVAGR